MVTRLVDVPRSVGDLISKAVLHFARERRWNDAHYDLWYHDEPVWIVRDSKPIGTSASRNGARLIIRVQLSAIDAPDQPESLHAVPDAYIVTGGHVSKRTNKRDRQGLASRDEQEAPSLLELQNRALDDPYVVMSIVERLLQHAWPQAEQLGRQLRENHGS